MNLRPLVTSICLTAGLLCWAGVPARAADTLPKGDEILDKFVDATGGKAAYEKVRNEKWTGTFEFPGKGIKGAVTGYRAEPSNSYTTVELEGVGTFEDGTNGETVWSRNSMQGPRLKQGDERAATLREAAFRAPIHWRKQYKRVENAGVESVDNQECYKVILTPNEGKPETRYFDVKTNLLVKMTMVVASPMGEIPSESTFSDYKEQNGLLSPHLMHQKAMGQEFIITIDHVEYNVDLPKDRFAVPADIQALVSKKTGE